MSKLSDLILKLRKEGLSYDKIKSVTGCSKSTISYHCGEGQKEKTLIRTRNIRRDPKYKRDLDKQQQYAKKRRRLVTDSYLKDLLKDCKDKVPLRVKRIQILRQRIFKTLKKL